jgi:hypothetical protein
VSTTDPDVRSRAVQEVLRPVAYVAIVVALVAGPVAGAIMAASAHPDDTFVAVYLPWLFVTVGFGLFAYYVLHHIAGMSVLAYSLAGAGAMFLIFAAGGIAEGGVGFQPLIPAAVLYVAAAVVYVIHRVHAATQKQTLATGVDATATVTRAAIMGRVNAAPLWHLTLSFTDQQGTKRWFRTHLLGISFGPGDRIPIKYDPAHPGDKRRIVVAPGSDGDMIQ